MAPPRQTGWRFDTIVDAMLEVRGGGSGGAGGAERPAPTIGRQVRAWAGSWRGAGVLLIVLCLAVYLPGLWSIPPVDRDESRFAQASRTMLESGDFVVPRIGDTPRLNKPPLIYWLQCASAATLGDGPGADGLGQWGNGNIWVFRLPSVLCAIGSVLLTWRLGLRMFDPRAAALGAAFLAASPMVIWDAHQARADQLLLFTTTGAMLALFDCWRATSRRAVTSREQSERSTTPRPGIVQLFLLYLFIALGILTKGPIAPMIVILTAIILSLTSRSFRWLLKLNPILGVIIIAAIVGPWVYLVGERVGWSVYLKTVYDETIGRGTEAKEHHWGPPGYHLVLLTVLFWPGSLLTAAGVVRGWRRGLRGFRVRHGTEAFLLAWIIPSWIVFELIATKLPHYIMPLYPAIALLSARAALSMVSDVPARFSGQRSRIVSFVIWIVVGFCGLFGTQVVFAIEDLLDGSYSRKTLTIALAGGVVLFGVMIGIIGSFSRLVRLHTLAIAAMVIWSMLTLEYILPRSRSLWVSLELQRAVAALDAADKPKAGTSLIALVGYQEDSAIFLSRGRAQRIAPADLAGWIERHPNGIVAIEADSGSSSTPEIARGLTWRTSVEGYNYSTGRSVMVVLFTKGPD